MLRNTNQLASVLTASILLAVPALGVNISAFADTLHCSDNNFFTCTNIAAGACCGPFPGAFGFSVRAFGLPGGAESQMFAATGCSSLIATRPGPNPCWTGAGTRAASASWATAGAAVQRGIQKETGCIPPNTYTFKGQDGRAIEIKITEEMAQGVASGFTFEDLDDLTGKAHLRLLPSPFETVGTVLSAIFYTFLAGSSLVSAAPLPIQRRIAQTIAESTAQWEQACLRAGGGTQCNPISQQAFTSLLAAGKNCDQQDAADVMIDLAKSLNNDPEMIRLSQIFVQQPRNAPDSFQVPYCMKLPRNSELNGLFHCQFAGSNFAQFSGDQTGNVPLGVQAVNPPGSCPAKPDGPVPDGTQLATIAENPGALENIGSPNDQPSTLGSPEAPSSDDTASAPSPPVLFSTFVEGDQTAEDSTTAEQEDGASDDQSQPTLPPPVSSPSELPLSATEDGSENGDQPEATYADVVGDGPDQVGDTGCQQKCPPPQATPPSDVPGDAIGDVNADEPEGIESLDGQTTPSPPPSSTGNPDSKPFTLANGQEAKALNAQFPSLSEDSPCQDGQNACIQGKFAQCVGGRFVVTPCGGGSQCFALPLVNSAGTSITCANADEAAARIALTDKYPDVPPRMFHKDHHRIKVSRAEVVHLLPSTPRMYINKLIPPAGTCFWKHEIYSPMIEESMFADGSPQQFLTWRIDAYIYAVNAVPDENFTKNGGIVQVVLVHGGAAETGWKPKYPTKYDYLFSIENRPKKEACAIKHLPSGASVVKGDAKSYPISYTHDMQMFRNNGNEAFTFTAQYEDNVDFDNNGKHTGGLKGSGATEWGVEFPSCGTYVSFPFAALSVFRFKSFEKVTFDCRTRVQLYKGHDWDTACMVTKRIEIDCTFSSEMMSKWTQSPGGFNNVSPLA
ncbi:hypothetical protein ONZ45_g13065 [Pleurotus djamor]|nr:hypothetical protein ONZ45_g13065 [Pleurotus djamor]